MTPGEIYYLAHDRDMFSPTIDNMVPCKKNDLFVVIDCCAYRGDRFTTLIILLHPEHGLIHASHSNGYNDWLGILVLQAGVDK
jgi:hypothetical protein